MIDSQYQIVSIPYPIEYFEKSTLARKHDILDFMDKSLDEYEAAFNNGECEPKLELTIGSVKISFPVCCETHNALWDCLYILAVAEEEFQRE